MNLFFVLKREVLIIPIGIFLIICRVVCNIVVQRMRMRMRMRLWNLSYLIVTYIAIIYFEWLPLCEYPNSFSVIIYRKHKKYYAVYYLIVTHDDKILRSIIYD